MRVQRTRSSPSALRSPLTRHPLGGTRHQRGAAAHAAAIVLTLFLAATPSSAERASPPAGCHWQDIPEIKAALAVPDGWEFRRLPEKGGVSAYEVVPAGPGIPNSPRSRFEMRFQRLARLDAVVARGRDFVQNALATSVVEDKIEEEKIGVVTLFAGVAQLSPDAGGTPQMTVAVSAMANAKTGALYTIRFEIPAAELAAVQPMANSLFRTVVIDDEV